MLGPGVPLMQSRNAMATLPPWAMPGTSPQHGILSRCARWAVHVRLQLVYLHRFRAPSVGSTASVTSQGLKDAAAAGACRQRQASLARLGLAMGNGNLPVHPSTPLAWSLEVCRPSAGHVTYDRRNTRYPRLLARAPLPGPALQRPGSHRPPASPRPRQRPHGARASTPVVACRQRAASAAPRDLPLPPARAPRLEHATAAKRMAARRRPPTAPGLPGKLLDAGREGGEGPRRLRCRCRRQASRVQGQRRGG